MFKSAKNGDDNDLGSCMLDWHIVLLFCQFGEL